MVRRRSKEEFLNAMAHLLTRKRAYSESLEVVRTALFRDLERAISLPANAPTSMLVESVARRRPTMNTEKLMAALSRQPSHMGRSEFLEAINELDQLRREFFHE